VAKSPVTAMREFAGSRSSGGTMSGMRALFAGRKRPERPQEEYERVGPGQGVRRRGEDRQTEDERRPRRSIAMSIFRREKRSRRPRAAGRRNGSIAQNVIAARAFVRSSGSGPLVQDAQEPHLEKTVPSAETICPVQRSRKFRFRRTLKAFMGHRSRMIRTRHPAFVFLMERACPVTA